MTNDFDVLDVHHHVGNAFRALGGADDATPELDEEEFARIELASRLEIMDRAEVRQAGGTVLTGLFTYLVKDPSSAAT